jgi:hypothetical protein
MALSLQEDALANVGGSCWKDCTPYLADFLGEAAVILKPNSPFIGDVRLKYNSSGSLPTVDLALTGRIQWALGPLEPLIIRLGGFSLPIYGPGMGIVQPQGYVAPSSVCSQAQALIEEVS